jgi:hypothetical protein
MYVYLIGVMTSFISEQRICAVLNSGPLTEAYLLGNVALKVGTSIDWDAKALKVTNCPEANQYLRREYRKGWEL